VEVFVPTIVWDSDPGPWWLGSRLLAWLGVPLCTLAGLSLARVWHRGGKLAAGARSWQRLGCALQAVSLLAALLETIPWLLGGTIDLFETPGGIAVVASTLLGAPAIAAWLYLGEWIETEETLRVVPDSRAPEA
jgi:hypothetical protein